MSNNNVHISKPFELAWNKRMLEMSSTFFLSSDLKNVFVKQERVSFIGAKLNDLENKENGGGCKSIY